MRREIISQENAENARSPRWTAESVELLKTLHASGHTALQIARELGITRNAVLGKVYRLGLSSRESARRGRLSLRTREPVSVEDML